MGDLATSAWVPFHFRGPNRGLVIFESLHRAASRKDEMDLEPH
jgi:hypothetical protein